MWIGAVEISMTQAAAAFSGLDLDDSDQPGDLTAAFYAFHGAKNVAEAGTNRSCSAPSVLELTAANLFAFRPELPIVGDGEEKWSGDRVPSLSRLGSLNTEAKGDGRGETRGSPDVRSVEALLTGSEEKVRDAGDEIGRIMAGHGQGEEDKEDMLFKHSFDVGRNQSRSRSAPHATMGGFFGLDAINPSSRGPSAHNTWEPLESCQEDDGEANEASETPLPSAEIEAPLPASPPSPTQAPVGVSRKGMDAWGVGGATPPSPPEHPSAKARAPKSGSTLAEAQAHPHGPMRPSSYAQGVGMGMNMGMGMGMNMGMGMGMGMGAGWGPEMHAMHQQQAAMYHMAPGNWPPAPGMQYQPNPVDQRMPMMQASPSNAASQHPAGFLPGQGVYGHMHAGLRVPYMPSETPSSVAPSVGAPPYPEARAPAPQVTKEAKSKAAARLKNREAGELQPAMDELTARGAGGEKEASKAAEAAAPSVGSVDQVVGRVALMSRDQLGCRTLQRMLDEQGEHAVDVIFAETLDCIVDLMSDPFGNYLCQKIFESCNADQLTKILAAAASSLPRVSLNMHGTRSAQKLVQCVTLPEQRDRVAAALGDSTQDLIKDLNGNHVIQRCLESLSEGSCNQFIFDTVEKHCLDVSCHRHGCCVVQRCLDAATPVQLESLVAALVGCADTLVTNAFGNYVVQYLLENVSISRPGLIEKLSARAAELSCEKFSSNVIEKCLQYSEDDLRSAVVLALADPMSIGKLLQDPFANYVVQKALSVATSPALEVLVSAIRPHLPGIKGTSYGRRIQSKIMKKTQAAAGMGIPKESPSKGRGRGRGAAGARGDVY